MAGKKTATCIKLLYEVEDDLCRKLGYKRRLDSRDQMCHSDHEGEDAMPVKK